MPDLTVSTAVDTFMQSADVDEMQSNLEVSSREGGIVVLKGGPFTILTAGAPADVGTITVPAWLTRYALVGSASGATGRTVTETSGGTHAAAGFTLRDAAAGGGAAVSGAFQALNTVVGGTGSINPVGTVASFTSSTLHVNQTANSANTGTFSVYLSVIPLV